MLRSLDKVVSLDDARLMRGVPLPLVMRNLGRVLDSNGRLPGIFDLSMATEQIGDFLSHNWSTARADKFLTLAVFYNTGPAVLAAWSVGALSFALTLAGYLPWFDFKPWSVVCLNSWISGHLAFFLVFFFLQDFSRLLPVSPRLVFLDRACINQRDAVWQRKGIENLAAFLRMSRRMVVIYSGTYLQRLWTVYELASFLLLHPETLRISFLPVAWVRSVASFILGGFLLSVLHWLLFFWLHAEGLHRAVPGALYMFISILANVFWSFSVRSWQRHRHSMEETIARFSIRSAVCAVEADRRLVEGNIVTFMSCRGWASAERPQEALEKFDEAVRTQLPKCLEASLEGRGLPYWMTMTCAMTFVLFAMDHAAAEISAGSGAVRILAEAWHNVLVTFCVGPLAIAGMNAVLGRRLHIRGKAEACLCLLATVPGLALFFASWLLAQIATLQADAGAPPMAVGVMLAFSLAVLAGTVRYYRRPAAARPMRCERPATPEAAPTTASDDFSAENGSLGDKEPDVECGSFAESGSVADRGSLVEKGSESSLSEEGSGSTSSTIFTVLREDEESFTL